MNENEDSQDLMCSNEMERRKTLNTCKISVPCISYGFHELICNHKQKVGSFLECCIIFMVPESLVSYKACNSRFITNRKKVNLPSPQLPPPPKYGS